jgi:hypothetical protein
MTKQPTQSPSTPDVLPSRGQHLAPSCLTTDVASSTGARVTLDELPRGRTRSPLASVDPRHPTHGIARIVRSHLPSARDVEIFDAELWSKLRPFVLSFVARRAVIWLFAQSLRWRGVTVPQWTRNADFVFGLGLPGQSSREFDVQVKAVRQPRYTYFPAGPRSKEDESLAALVRFLDGYPPEIYLIPAREWTTLESYPLLTRRSYPAELNKPDKLGINVAANLDKLERFRLERTVERLAHDPELGRPSDMGRSVPIAPRTNASPRKSARVRRLPKAGKRPLPK